MASIAEFHPIIVHFPIALFTLYAISEILNRFIEIEHFNKLILLFLFLGVFFSVAAVLTGNQAEQIAAQLINDESSHLHEVIELHEEYATLTLWYFFFVLILRVYLVLKKKMNNLIQVLLIILAVIGGILIFETGISGGHLVFDYGIGTQLFR